MEGSYVLAALGWIAKYVLTYWASAFAHELGHAAVGRYLGLQVLGIRPGLVIWSCRVACDSAWARMDANPKARFAMSIAGWLMHWVLLLAAGALLLIAGPDSFEGFAERFIVVNAVLIVLVAIPTGDANQDADKAYKALKELRRIPKEASS